MYLSRIVVRHFRNLTSLDVSFGPGLNVLVGVNNIGKTNLLDAIRVALGPASTGPDTVWFNHDDLSRDNNGAVLSASFRIDLYFAGLTEDECGEFLDLLEYDPDAPKRSGASLHFEATWSQSRGRFEKKRWGGNRPEGEAPIPEDVLQSLPVTLLGALRDAEKSLRPGRESRLGQLIQAHSSPQDRSRIESIVSRSNALLERTAPVKNSQQKIIGALQDVAGADYAPEAVIRMSEAQFERVANSLRLILKLGGTDPASNLPATEELRANGLGYNNLLYIATVLAQLESTTDTALPLFLVEEPEAHLHPQMQVVLARFLELAAADKTRRVQTIVTTHSPTIVSSVSPKTLTVLHRAASLQCSPLLEESIGDKELRQVKRFLDVTRAALLFSRGVIFVEGISEMLLIPVLARRLGLPLEDHHVSVVQTSGVGFPTLLKMFHKNGLGISAAIVTDADPPRVLPDDGTKPAWRGTLPKVNSSGGFEEAPRVTQLRQDVQDRTSTKLFVSKVTLEYDLAEAALSNADKMCEAWSNLLKGPQTFNSDLLAAAGADLQARALAAWRGICVASPSVGKADFAHELAELLDPKPGDLRTPKELSAEFTLPPYLENAIRHAFRDISDIP